MAPRRGKAKGGAPVAPLTPFRVVLTDWQGDDVTKGARTLREAIRLLGDYVDGQAVAGEVRATQGEDEVVLIRYSAEGL